VSKAKKAGRRAGGRRRTTSDWLAAYEAGELFGLAFDPHIRYRRRGTSPRLEDAHVSLAEALGRLGYSAEHFKSAMKSAGFGPAWHLSRETGNLLRAMWLCSGLVHTPQLVKSEPESIAQVLSRIVSLTLRQLMEEKKLRRCALRDDDLWDPIGRVLDTELATKEKGERLLEQIDEVYCRAAAVPPKGEEGLPSSDEELGVIVQAAAGRFNQSRQADPSVDSDSPFWKLDPLWSCFRDFQNKLWSDLQERLTAEQRAIFVLGVCLYYLYDARRAVPDGLLVTQEYLEQNRLTHSRFLWVFKHAQDLGRWLEVNARIPDSSPGFRVRDEASMVVESGSITPSEEAAIRTQRERVATWARERRDQLITYLSLPGTSDVAERFDHAEGSDPKGVPPRLWTRPTCPNCGAYGIEFLTFIEFSERSRNEGVRKPPHRDTVSRRVSQGKYWADATRKVPWCTKCKQKTPEGAGVEPPVEAPAADIPKIPPDDLAKLKEWAQAVTRERYPGFDVAFSDAQDPTCDPATERFVVAFEAMAEEYQKACGDLPEMRAKEVARSAIQRAKNTDYESKMQSSTPRPDVLDRRGQT